MLYNRLTIQELERRVYIEPDNAAAAAELLRRVPEMLDLENAALVEERERADALEKRMQDQDSMLSALDEDLDLAHARARALEERIKELTYAGDLI